MTQTDRAANTAHIMRTPFRLRISQPKAIPVSLEGTTTDLQIARINDLTRAGRANWFGLLAYLAFTMITLLAVEDVDFFVDSRQTALPLIGVSIPTGAFFYAAPLLGAALHVYLHLFVRKCTAALMAPPACYNDERLETHILPWLLNDLMLRWRTDGSAERRPLDAIATVTAVLLIWVAGPFVLGFAWVRSWPAHEPLMSYLALTCFLIATYASLSSWVRLLGDRDKDTASLSEIGQIIGFVSLGLITIPLTEQRTDTGTFERPSKFSELVSFLRDEISGRESLLDFDPETWLGALSKADLSEELLTPLPADWLPFETHKRRFRIEWCAGEGLDPETCGLPHFSDIEPVPHLWTLRYAWCDDTKRGLDEVACQTYFSTLDRRFISAWSTERTTKRSTLTRWAPTRRDLRGANLSNASLTAADLRRARMEGADLSGAQMEGVNLRIAQMEGADLINAQMEGANLSGAQMEGANLSGAQMEGADLSFAQMEGADLRGAKMEGADLRDAQMEGANLRGAQMEGADLSFAQMEGADLRGAKMEGADLRGANLKSASWAGVTINSVPAQDADFRGAQDLVQSRLSSLIGNVATLLPDDLDHFVCTCWSTDPPNWSTLVENLGRQSFGMNEDQARAAYLCPPGQRPEKTGTPWPLDLPKPDDLLMAGERDLLHWRRWVEDPGFDPFCPETAQN